MKSNYWKQKLRIVGGKVSILVGTRLIQAGSKGPEEYQNKPATEDNSLCKDSTERQCYQYHTSYLRGDLDISCDQDNFRLISSNGEGRWSGCYYYQIEKKPLVDEKIEKKLMSEGIHLSTVD